MENEIRVVVFGLGPVGAAITKEILAKKGMRIVGAADIAKELAGRDLGEVLGVGRTLGVPVTSDAETLLSEVKPHIVVVATKSSLRDIHPQLTLCIKAGVDVISTCEELSYPHYRNPRLSAEIDELAKKYGATVLGTGINPGFLMDALPIVLTGACLRVDSIRITRMMDSSKRRNPYQKKIGTGLAPEQFANMIREKTITGHVGLTESTAMIAAALGWKLDAIEEFPPEPFIAQNQITTSYTTIKPGHVTGLKSVARGIRDGKPVIVMEFISHAGVEEEYDAISIQGVPNVNQRIAGGVHGDTGTAAVVVNMIPKVLNAKAGLVTMKDLPLPSALSEDLRVYLHRDC